MPIDILDQFQRANNGDFALLESTDINGGWMTVADTTERDAIVASVLRTGQHVWVETPGELQKWNGSSWEAASIGGGGGGGGAGNLTGWQLVETKEVTGAATGTLNFTGLNGNLDEEYLIIVNALCVTTALRRFAMLPNSVVDDTLLRSEYSGVAKSALILANTAADAFYAVARFRVSTNPDGGAVAHQRNYICETTVYDPGAGNNPTREIIGGTWVDTTTNLTNLEFRAYDDGVIGAAQPYWDIGTTISVYKRAVGSDELVRVSANDTTAGYLSAKITAGTGIALNELNDGADEDLEVSIGSLTLAELNTAVSDATLDDSASARTPTAHSLGGAEHNSDLLANLNAKISDATLDDQNDPRPADEIITTDGPTTLAVGAVLDGEYLRRSGSTVIGGTPAGGGGSLTVEDDGTPLTTAATKLNFTGAGVSLTEPIADEITITIPGGGASGPGVGGLTGWQKIETKEVIGSDVSSVTFTGLDGNVDGTYLIEWTVIRSGAAGTRRYRLNPNGLDGVIRSDINGTEYPDNLLFRNGQSISTGYSVFYASTNPDGSAVAQKRRLIGLHNNSTDGSNISGARQVSQWNDTSTNLTSIEIESASDSNPGTVGNYIGIGSVFTIYKRTTGAANVTGGLEFMDEIVVTSAQTTVSFGVGGDGLFQRALDGNVDEEYVLDGTIVPAIDTNTDYSLRPNGISLNQKSQYVLGQATPGSGDLAYLFLSQYLASFTPASTTLSFDASLSAKTGVPRKFRNQHGLIDTGVTDGRVFVVSGSWNDISTNITTLDIVSSLASNIGPGSRIRLFRRVSQNLRADTADTAERQATAVVAQGLNSEVEYTVGRANYNGSAIAIGVALDDTVTAGTLTARLKVAGSTVLETTLDSTNNPTFNRAQQSLGVHKVKYGDEILLSVLTDGSFATTGGGSRGLVLTGTLSNEALIQPPAGGMVHVKTVRIENANQTTITFDNLDGDVDGIYVIEYLLRRDAANTATDFDLYLNPNGIVASQQTRLTFPQTPSTDDVTRLMIGRVSKSAGVDMMYGTCTFFAKRNGFNRIFHCETTQHFDPNAANNNRIVTFNGAWADTTTLVTSLQLEASLVSNLGIGSEFRLYKLTEGDNVEVL